MQKIKLVIWDLDETFWKGTLSEEGVIPVQEHIDIIEKLTSRGIINSICSKNDFDQARNQLIQLGVWDYFIFPSISWNPKGPQVQGIIDQCQLRAENVLFLDDNHLNLEEVKYYNEGIIAEDPDFILNYLEHEVLQGKDDSEHTRLKQYKLLEKKSREKTKYTSNDEFLKDSDIKIARITDLESVRDRIMELLTRTNQLNFTKIRPDEEEVNELLQNRELENFAVRVTDRFGDYGIAGFVSYNPVEHKLIHYVFSCRILNLGIEQYLYRKLNAPLLEIEGDVASSVEEPAIVDWISESGPEQESKDKDRTVQTKSGNKLLFVGSCELGSIFNYLAAYSESIDIHGVKAGENNLPEFSDHLETIFGAKKLSKSIIDKACNLPFVSRRYAMSNRIYDFDYDVLIYSVVANYDRNVYRNRRDGYRVAWGEFKKNLTAPNPSEELKSYFNRKNVCGGAEFLENFRNEFEHLGLLHPERFYQLLDWLRESIPTHIPLLLLNGSEVNRYTESEPEAVQRHQEMNRVLDQFIENTENCYLVDVRKLIEGEEDMGKNIRTFQRYVYKRISDEIIRIMEQEVGLTLRKNVFRDIAVLCKHYLYRTELWIKSISFLRKPFIINTYRKITQKK